MACPITQIICSYKYDLMNGHLTLLKYFTLSQIITMQFKLLFCVLLLVALFGYTQAAPANDFSSILAPASSTRSRNRNKSLDTAIRNAGQAAVDVANGGAKIAGSATSGAGRFCGSLGKKLAKKLEELYYQYF
ncbi:hypothetical protein MBANPS3_011730 [Mucor bainieri]